MNFKEYSKNNNSFTSNISTVIEGKVKISSIYRKYVSPVFEVWG